MKTLFATLALFACLVTSAFAEGSFTNFTTVTMRDTSVRITADTALAAINTGWATQVVVSVKLQDLGGTATYCPILLTSIDGAEWDSVRTDTLTAEEQNTVWTLSIYDAIKTGGGGNTAAGANTASVALSRYLKVYIDEVGADTGGSELWVQAFIRESR